jgi:hypothetical protein
LAMSGEDPDTVSEARRLHSKVEEETWQKAALVGGAAPDKYLEFFLDSPLGPALHLEEALTFRERFAPLSRLSDALRSAGVCDPDLGGLRQEDMQLTLDRYLRERQQPSRMLSEMSLEEIDALAEEISGSIAARGRSKPAVPTIPSTPVDTSARIAALSGCWKSLPDLMHADFPEDLFDLRITQDEIKIRRAYDVKILSQEEFEEAIEKTSFLPSGPRGFSIGSERWIPLGDKWLGIESLEACPFIPSVSIYERVSCR